MKPLTAEEKLSHIARVSALRPLGWAELRAIIACPYGDVQHGRGWNAGCQTCVKVLETDVVNRFLELHDVALRGIDKQNGENGESIWNAKIDTSLQIELDAAVGYLRMWRDERRGA